MPYINWNCTCIFWNVHFYILECALLFYPSSFSFFTNQTNPIKLLFEWLSSYNFLWKENSHVEELTLGVKVAPRRWCPGGKERVCHAGHEGPGTFRGMKSCVQGTTGNLTGGRWMGSGSARVDEIIVELDRQELVNTKEFGLESIGSWESDGF